MFYGSTHAEVAAAIFSIIAFLPTAAESSRGRYIG